DAIVPDRETGYYLDPDRLHGLNHKGAHFQVAGPLNVPRSPQGAPVIFQAGASAEGQTLAAHTAEVVFSSNPDREGAKRYYDALKAEVMATGRDAGSCLILSAVQPIVAETVEAAQHIADGLDSLIHPELALSLLQMQLGNVVDLSLFDPDGPLPDLALSNASQSGQARIVALAQREGLSILELAQRIAAGRTAKTMVGTAEMVAEEMEDWFRAGVCDGFIVAPPYLPDSLAAFVEGVIPILQTRGLFRTAYESATLRGNLGLSIPGNRDAARHVEPEIW
ncbi:MAG: NtaA/DmoA family FMN-dependent monooxygenase, partial [Sphingobium sp.]